MNLDLHGAQVVDNLCVRLEAHRRFHHPALLIETREREIVCVCERERRCVI